MKEFYSDCTLCPRECHANRSAGGLGFCRMNDKLSVARASLHIWEEPCISGKNGSGTIFFAGCSLGCSYCQNYEISRGEAGIEISAGRLCEIMLELQQKGAHNINLVTAAHYTPHIVMAAKNARIKGLDIPILYNSSGYEKAETINKLSQTIDIYMPDMKYINKKTAEEYSAAPNYFDIADMAISEMVKQQKKCVFDENGMLKHGVLVRHMVLPGHVNESKRILRHLYQKYGDDIYISIMNQYTPTPAMQNTLLNRRVTYTEYRQVVDYAMDIGIKNAYIQEGGTANESFIPPFDAEGVLKYDD